MSVTADQHFAIIPEWVLYADISSHAVRLYATLRRYADKQGKAHPSRQTLADNMHTSVPTVKRAIEELMEIGAIDRGERYDDDGRQTSNQYRVITTPPRVTGEPHGGVTGEPGERVTGEPRTIASSELEPEELERTTSSRAYSTDFEEFWNRYPVEGRHDKPKAAAALASALRRASLEEILAGVDRYAADPNREKTKYAQGWLSGDRWAEGPLPSMNGNKPYDNAAEILRRAQGGADGSQPSAGPRGLASGVLPITETS